LAQLTDLLDAVGERCLAWDPIDILRIMSTSDELLYCWHAYGYTNYSREGYAPSRVTFTDFVGPGSPAHAGTTLGGAGLAISARTRHLAIALEYLQWLARPECQRTTYLLAGGQPGNAAAWDDELANAVTGGFFRATRRTIEDAYVRPTHPGMHAFQAAAGSAIRVFLLRGASASETLRVLNREFRRSLMPQSNGP
jgi:multiple sugar transport system substrate-binding protein